MHPLKRRGKRLDLRHRGLACAERLPWHTARHDYQRVHIQLIADRLETEGSARTGEARSGLVSRANTHHSPTCGSSSRQFAIEHDIVRGEDRAMGNLRHPPAGVSRPSTAGRGCQTDRSSFLGCRHRGGRPYGSRSYVLRFICGRSALTVSSHRPTGTRGGGSRETTDIRPEQRPTFSGSGGPGEFHPWAPTEPYVNLSVYTALVVLVAAPAGGSQVQCAKYLGCRT